VGHSYYDSVRRKKLMGEVLRSGCVTQTQDLWSMKAATNHQSEVKILDADTMVVKHAAGAEKTVRESYEHGALF
jgi:hypothetical protein